MGWRARGTSQRLPPSHDGSQLYLGGYNNALSDSGARTLVPALAACRAPLKKACSRGVLAALCSVRELTVDPCRPLSSCFLGQS